MAPWTRNVYILLIFGHSLYLHICICAHDIYIYIYIYIYIHIHTYILKKSLMENFIFLCSESYSKLSEYHLLKRRNNLYGHDPCGKYLHIYIPRGVATKTRSHFEINAIVDGSNLALYTSP